MKITTKTTKEQLKSFLGANAKNVQSKDKALFDQMVYADKMMKKDEAKVARKDLVDLVKSVIALLGESIVEPALAQETPVAENSVKKLSKGVSKTQKPAEEPKQEEPAPATETPKAEPKEEKKEVKGDKTSSKKSLGKKEPKEGVTVLNDSDNKKAVQLAKIFPKNLEAGDTKYALAEDIKTMEDLYNALNNDEEIVFAYYWSKRHLKQFDYFGGLLGQPKSFDNDLDLCTAIYVSDEQKVAYQVSMYTEAIYSIIPTDFEEEDGIRVAGGIEFQIYRAV